MSAISFLPLDTTDLPLMHRWLSLNQSLWQNFYRQTPLSFDEVCSHYSSRILGLEPIFCHIATIGKKPFGYLQCYMNADDPVRAASAGRQGVSIDYFIGEPELLGKGLAKEMLAAYVKNIVPAQFPRETSYFTCHPVTDAAAIAVAQGAEFRPEKIVLENQTAKQLLRREIALTSTR